MDIAKEYDDLYKQHQNQLEKEQAPSQKPEVFLNPYQVLQVKSTSSGGDVRKSFQKMSLLIHPDKCQHPGATEAFQVVRSAYDILLNPLKRSQVDN